MYLQVGSGYSLAELKDLGMKLKPYWKCFNTKSPPESVLLAPGFKVIHVESTFSANSVYHVNLTSAGETRYVD